MLVSIFRSLLTGMITPFPRHGCFKPADELEEWRADLTGRRFGGRIMLAVSCTEMEKYAE